MSKYPNKQVDKIYMKYFLPILFLFSCLMIIGCSESYTPKPRAYPRIIYPEKGYQAFNKEECPFTFEYPQYANYIKDSLFFDEKIESPCWFNLDMPHFKGRIYASYKTINKENDFYKLVQDAHKMRSKHVIRADFIDDRIFIGQPGVTGMIYELGGNAASPVQFFVSDSTQHFLRGALYFEHTPNIDSLGPVIDYVKEDMYRFLNSLQWKQ